MGRPACILAVFMPLIPRMIGFPADSARLLGMLTLLDVVLFLLLALLAPKKFRNVLKCMGQIVRERLARLGDEELELTEETKRILRKCDVIAVMALVLIAALFVALSIAAVLQDY